MLLWGGIMLGADCSLRHRSQLYPHRACGCGWVGGLLGQCDGRKSKSLALIFFSNLY